MTSRTRKNPRHDIGTGRRARYGPESRRRRHLLRTAATLSALALAATACGDETLTTPEPEEAILQSFEIGPEGEQIRITDALELTAFGRLSDGSTSAVEPAELDWSVASGPDFVSVDGLGTVQGLAIGTAVVRAEHPAGLHAEVEVTVRPFIAEGAADSPLAPALPHRGEVDAGTSVYRFGGLVAGETYTVAITSIHGEVGALGFSDGSQSWERCRSPYQSDDILCPVPAGPAGEVHLDVRSRDASGAIYTIDVAAGGIPNEGSIAEPRDITGSLPYGGTVSNAESHYVVRGLTPGRNHTVHLTQPSEHVNLFVASSAEGTRQTEACQAQASAMSDVSCTRPANGDGEIHVRVFGGFTRAGAFYGLDVVEGGLFDEGISFQPVDLTGRLPYSGQVGMFWSHYVVKGLEAGATYTITLDGVSDDVSLRVHSAFGGSPASLQCESHSIGAGVSESCAGRAENGELYIDVGGGHTVEGATFTVDVVPGGIAREGNVVEPLDLTGALPHNGSANASGSFYRVTGLVPGSPVTVTLTGITADVGLSVEERDTGEGGCWSENVGTADESCVATVGPSGDLYIRVTTRKGVVGAYFVLDLSTP